LIDLLKNMDNQQLVDLARQLLDSTANKNIVVRLIGGAAVMLTCENAVSHAGLQRVVSDADFVAAKSDIDQVARIFEEQGLSRRRAGGNRICFQRESLQVDLSDLSFREDFSLDLSERLCIQPTTLPMADLLLIKLQRRKFEEKDIKDSIALLLDHRVALEEAEDQISSKYIAQMTRGNWGRFHTVYDNLVALEKLLPKYIEPEEAQLVWRRIELIQGEMDRTRKSLAWIINQIFRKPSEVAR
jgi:hypothetical protein